MLTARQPPPAPLAAGNLPPSVADRFELVPCTVDPRQVRLLVFSGGKIDFTVRQPGAAQAERYLDNYCNDASFRSAARKAATLNMEMY